MQRRNFLKQSALAASALGISSTLHARKNEEIILGHHNKRYKLDTEWGKLDFSRYPVKDCHEMVQDSKGRILLLTNDTHNNVIIYDKKGKLITTWGKEYPGAHGLTLFNENGTEVLFICDNNRHQVIKTTLDGRVLMTLDYPKETGQYTKPEEYVPTETAIAANGDIYVADGYGKDFVIQYDSKGKYIRHFCGRGDTDAHVKNAHGVCIDTRDKNNPTLIVTSREQNAFKRYTTDGKYLNTIALPGAWVCRPVINGDHLYAAVLQSNAKQWKESGFITILDKDFKVVSNLAGTEPVYNNGALAEMQQSSPVFKYPHDVCIDDEQNIYVAQWNSGNVYPYKLKPVV
ncbi:twin-arginine translocation signal domain-containing protein [Panacibacter sp. DH6]|uniref:Twin-arginine translocation signal domain-containing protein n=1 Tax=Panacibacter microcysteis TaxID=2793269 RepID=A0A931DZG6_9BACT|nr:twin-arginine translocation signal domain-containing protein [Panacibacter microcysteis]MBG9375802.1 twin-arginine translocation signal domain-containing protein [Panacibacter microcysteis]